MDDAVAATIGLPQNITCANFPLLRQDYCSHVRQHCSDADMTSGMFDYLGFVYCDLPVEGSWFGTVVLVNTAIGRCFT